MRSASWRDIKINQKSKDSDCLEKTVGLMNVWKTVRVRRIYKKKLRMALTTHSNLIVP